MQCKDMMRRPVQFARESDTVAVGARKMRDFNVGFLPVCDREGKVQGVVTDRDIALRVCAEDRSPSRTRIDAIMSQELVVCRPDEDFAVAQQRMSKQKKSRILIVAEGGRPLGVISLSDIAARLDPRASETLRSIAQREVLNGEGRTSPS